MLRLYREQPHPDARGRAIVTESEIPGQAAASQPELARLRQELAEAQYRIAELQHVIRDAAQIGLGVVSIVASRRDTAEARVMAKEIRLRLGAIGVAISSSSGGRVEIAGCIEKLARETASVFGRASIGQRLDLAPVHVQERAAVSIALVAIELLTNAYQHAFVDRAFGSIEIRLAPVNDRLGTLCIVDNGIGIAPAIAANWPEVLPGGRQSGLSTARSLVGGLGGQLRLTGGAGTRVEFSFPTAG